MAIETYLNKIHNMDALELLKVLPDESIDLLITDPPYMTTITSLSKDTPAYNQLKSDAWLLPVDWIPEVVRVMKSGAAYYCFCGTDEMSDLVRAFKSCGCKVTNSLVWIKTNPLPSYTKRTYRGAVELAIYGCKDHFGYFIDKSQDELMPYWFEPIVGGDVRTDHPTQKPLDIIQEWVINSCPPNGIVLDPFVGSGTTALAALRAGVNFIACDKSPEYCAIAEDRLRLPFTPRAVTPANDVSDLPLFAALDTR